MSEKQFLQLHFTGSSFDSVSLSAPSQKRTSLNTLIGQYSGTCMRRMKKSIRKTANKHYKNSSQKIYMCAS